MKLIFTLFTALFFTFSLSSEAKTIPYPLDYDITSEGASSAAGSGNYQDSPYFKQIDFYNLKSNSHLTILEKFKTYQQTTEWSCGNAAALMVLRHYGDTRYQELEIAPLMNTTALPADGNFQPGVLYGTQTAGMANFFRQAGYEVESSLVGEISFASPEEFKNWVLGNLKNNNPILVDWFDWSGHWQVIIGYDTLGTETLYDDVVIFADPYDVGDHLQDGYYVYPMLRFYYMWEDAHYQPTGQQSQQWVIAKPKN